MESVDQGESGERFAYDVEALFPADVLRAETRIYEIYKRLRVEDPVHRLHPNYFIVSRYADFLTVFKDPRFGRRGLLLPTFEDVPTYCLPVLFADPPDHTRLRGLITRTFAQQVVERLRPEIEQGAEKLLDAAERKGSFELIRDFAYRLPLTTLCVMMGMPRTDHDRIHELSIAHGQALVANPATPEGRETLKRTNKIQTEWAEYFRRLAEERRRKPEEDICTMLVQARDGADKLSDYELVATLMGLLFAGHSAVCDAIGNGVVALLRHPDQWERLRKDPSLMETAVDETLRYDSAAHASVRMTLEDAEISGVRIPKGAVVAAINGSANRDPAAFPDPDRFDVARKENRHVTFGFGVHRCLGATLAKAQLGISYRTLARRYPKLRMASEPTWHPNFAFRGLEQLELAFE